MDHVVIPDATIQACYQCAAGGKALEKRVTSVTLNVYQSTGIETEDGSRQSLENHAKLDEIRRLSNKKFEESHDVHRCLALAEDYSRPTKREEYQYVSGIMGISYNRFLDAKAGAAYMNFEVTELLKFWTQKIFDIDPTGARSRQRAAFCRVLRLGGKDDILYTNLGTVWRSLRPSWCPQPQANLNKEVTERVRLSPEKNEDLGNLNVLHNLILPHRRESEEIMSKPNESPKKLEPGGCRDLASGGGDHSCDGRSCIRIQSSQSKDLATWFGEITKKEKSEVQIVAECYANTTVNLETALRFFSRICNLESLEMLESDHHLVTALSVEFWPGVLQMVQKHIKGCKSALRQRLGFP